MVKRHQSIQIELTSCKFCLSEFIPVSIKTSSEIKLHMVVLLEFSMYILDRCQKWHHWVGIIKQIHAMVLIHDRKKNLHINNYKHAKTSVTIQCPSICCLHTYYFKFCWIHSGIWIFRPKLRSRKRSWNYLLKISWCITIILKY